MLLALDTKRRFGRTLCFGQGYFELALCEVKMGILLGGAKKVARMKHQFILSVILGLSVMLWFLNHHHLPILPREVPFSKLPFHSVFNTYFPPT
jgi:hypothetical protein